MVCVYQKWLNIQPFSSKDSFLEARASLEPGLSVTQSLGHSHFSSSTSRSNTKVLMVFRMVRIPLRMVRMVKIGLNTIKTVHHSKARMVTKIVSKMKDYAKK